MTEFRSFWKQPMAGKVRKAMARAPLVSQEQQAMRAVRQADKTCRFPWCGCRRFKLALHVAHAVQHRGMGGNPKGDRSDPSGLILVCAARHRQNVISLDRKTLKAVPLDARRGLRGPVKWLIDLRAYRGQAGAATWFEVAREKAPHDLEYPSLPQQEILNALAEMQR